MPQPLQEQLAPLPVSYDLGGHYATPVDKQAALINAEQGNMAAAADAAGLSFGQWADLRRQIGHSPTDGEVARLARGDASPLTPRGGRAPGAPAHGSHTAAAKTVQHPAPQRRSVSYAPSLWTERENDAAFSQGEHLARLDRAKRRGGFMGGLMLTGANVRWRFTPGSRKIAAPDSLVQAHRQGSHAWKQMIKDGLV